jgi:hypothetical protein
MYMELVEGEIYDVNDMEEDEEEGES